MTAQTTKPRQNEPKAGRRRLLSRLGWGALLIGHLILLFMPTDHTSSRLSPEMWLLAILLLLLLIWVALLAGFLLVMAGNLSFFKQIKGVLLTLILLAISFRAWFVLVEIAPSPPGWLINQLTLTVSVWLLVLPFALGSAVLVYLIFRDRSVQLTAITALILVWSLLIYIRLYDADALLRQVIIGSPGGQLWWFHTLLCLTFWLILIAPFSFIGHTLWLLYRERSASVSYVQETTCACGAPVNE